ncbi:lytic polysaccharide monooxygenase [Micromonospora sp. NBC_01699]|uniref:lytic polysaccharide monooxygenase n=1 Tax=Micromonospora sp. NBC_01699 TaxID=2975984 RepID=UPI002E2FB644|nr:lytic polysaccharide monooxygenase [Micromonospora sp. NBC_01699]
MTVRRKLFCLVAATVVAAALSGLAAGPALAHGAPGSPVSRSVACGPDAPTTNRSAACRAAIAAGAVVAQWDNVRVAGVAGRDRQKIPDGRLCSGGVDAFGGLDLARADWPATRLTAGGEFTFTYRTTIPHEGTFRWYVTSTGYDPTRPLTWSDLGERPFLTATDPPRSDGAYRMRGRLPAGLSGRHVIFAIWQNSSTPDTYYSCSDVIFGGAPAPAGAGTRSATGAARPGGGASASTGAADPATVAGIGSADTDTGTGTRTAAAATGGGIPPLWLGLAGVLLAAAVLVPIGLRLRSRTSR